MFGFLQTVALTTTEAELEMRVTERNLFVLLILAAILLVLAIVWMVINITQKLRGTDSSVKLSRSASVNGAKQPNAEDAAVAAAIAAAIAANEDDGAVVAAIIAAISAMRAEEGYTGGFRVVSFKRAMPKSRRRF